MLVSTAVHELAHVALTDFRFRGLGSLFVVFFLFCLANYTVCHRSCLQNTLREETGKVFLILEDI